MVYLLIIILIILIMPIKVVILKDDRRSDIDLYFTKLFNLRLDFDEFIAFLITDKENPNKVSSSRIIENYHLYKRTQNVIKTTTSMIKLKKITLIVKTKGKSKGSKMWLYVISWIYLSFVQNNIHRYFKKVENEHYNQISAERFNLNFELQFNFRFIYLLFALIKNIKDIPKIFRSKKKGSKIHGTTSHS
jgi:hypothetical protein